MIELLQFRHSPYNEKVRWALDLKRVPHRRRSLLPGPHMATVRKLTGRTHTPVILADGQALDGSARILEWLEARWPQPALLPRRCGRSRRGAAHPAVVRRGPDAAHPARGAATRCCASPRPLPTSSATAGRRCSAWPMRCAVPLAAPLIRKGNGIAGAASVDDGLRAAEQALDFVAQRAGADGYLAGQRLQPGRPDGRRRRWPCWPSRRDSPMAGPQACGAAFAALLQRFAAHPAIAWTRQLYARHRGAEPGFRWARVKERER